MKRDGSRLKWPSEAQVYLFLVVLLAVSFMAVALAEHL